MRGWEAVVNFVCTRNERKMRESLGEGAVRWKGRGHELR